MQSYYESFRDSMPLPFTMYTDKNTCLPHFHAGIELCYVLKGSFSATVGGVSVTVKERELLICNSYSVHTYTAPECSCIVSIIPLSVVPTLQKLLTTNRFRSPVISDDRNGSLEFLLRMLMENPDNAVMQKGLSYTLLGYLTGRVPLDPVNSSDQTDFVCRILNYLNDRYMQRLTVEQVAAHFGYSRSRFSHLFKSTIGYSLPQYLNILRCRAIAEELLTTDTPVVNLAMNAGFNNMHTFYSAFRLSYGMTPGEYVRSHKAGD